LFIYIIYLALSQQREVVAVDLVTSIDGYMIMIPCILGMRSAAP
jgi:hypothetical protein